MASGGIGLATAILLAGSEWGYPPGDQPPSAKDREIYVQFKGDGRVSGAAGCNTYSGRYEQDGGKLTVTELKHTVAHCALPGVMEAERQFLALLGFVRNADATHLKLVLKDGEGRTLAVLVRRDRD